MDATTRTTDTSLDRLRRALGADTDGWLIVLTPWLMVGILITVLAVQASHV